MKIKKMHILAAALVLALGAAVYLNWQFSGSSSAKSASKELGAATYVSRDTAATADEALTGSKRQLTPAEQLIKARTDRAQAQDKALSSAKEMITLSENSDDVKKAAVEKASEIERRMIAQSNVENILSAKGFSDVICYAGEKGCTVTVLSQDMKQDSPLIIKDVVMSQLEIGFNDIVIVDV